MFDSGYILNVETAQYSDWLCSIRKRYISRMTINACKDRHVISCDVIGKGFGGRLEAQIWVFWLEICISILVRSIK